MGRGSFVVVGRKVMGEWGWSRFGGHLLLRRMVEGWLGLMKQKGYGELVDIGIERVLVLVVVLMLKMKKEIAPEQLTAS